MKKLLVLGYSVMLLSAPALAESDRDSQELKASGVYHAPAIACYAQDNFGHTYWSTGYSSYLVQKRAMATCYYNASYCWNLGCQPMH